MKIRRHKSVNWQGAWRGAVLRGHYGDCAMPGNSNTPANLRWKVTRR